ncbi:RNA polymerase sigma factor, partial [Bacteroides heparinolyticus]|uniref:RNA polymerase sigma factor n=1 Tax=Prevotella heparinolytica TaxID=28113 RepID=UPI0035A1749F
MNTQEIHKDMIERINKGDEKAFELLYNHYFVYLCSCTNAYIFNANEAQDIVNEVFVNIWHR